MAASDVNKIYGRAYFSSGRIGWTDYLKRVVPLVNVGLGEA
jgi:hypothetical protein